MKKQLVSLAVGAALSAGAVAAQAGDADVNVYGKVHLSYGAILNEETGGATTTTYTDNWQLRSHASRLGVKGSAAISDSLKGVYQLEYGVNPDSTTNAGLSSRNQYAGLAGNFGTVLFGRHDTPTKVAQGKVDEFNDTDGDIVSMSRAENRIGNVLAYASPNWGGFDFMAAFAPGEGNGETTGGDGPLDTISLMGEFKTGGLFVSLGHDQYDDTIGGLAYTLGYKDLTRLVATFGNKKFQVGGLYETSSKVSDTAGTDKDMMAFSFHVTFAGAHKIKGQYQMATEKDTADGDVKEGQFSFGYDWKMGDKSTFYAMVTAYVNDMGADVTADEEYSFLGVGLIQDF